MERKENSTIRTYSGAVVNVLDPSPNDISITDIAHALSLQVRFNGHITKFYSVAEHCVRVSLKCLPEFALWGLFHDAAEAYIGDMIAPLKHQPEMSRFRAVEKRLMVAICSKIGLDEEEPPEVKVIDRRLFKSEARDLRLSPIAGDWYPEVEAFEERIWPWSPEHAEGAFLARYRALTKDVDISFPFGYCGHTCAPDKTLTTGFQASSIQLVRQPEPLTKCSRLTTPAKKGSCG